MTLDNTSHNPSLDTDGENIEGSETDEEEKSEKEEDLIQDAFELDD